MAEPMEQGLYAALNVLPTRGLIDYMETLPKELGARVNPQNAHVSLSYAHEMVAAGAKGIDPERLGDAEAEIRNQIDALDLDGETIMPAASRLEPFKRFWVVPIEPSEAIYEAHRTVSWVVKETFGVDIANWRDDYHLSVRRRPVGKGRGGMPPLIPFPNGFILKGNRVEVNDVDGDIQPHHLCMSRSIRAQRDFAAVAS